MTPTSATDAGIVAQRAALLAGDPTAIDAWYRAEHPQVWRLCLGVLADAAEAEDLAQDAMLHLLDHLDRWDPRRSWHAWRNTVVVNLCRDRMRRRSTRSTHESAAAAVLQPGPLPSPADAAHASELRVALLAALAALTPREREAFVLVDLQGAPAAQAAEVMDIAEGTVRSLLTLARRRLRGLLASHMPAPSGAEPA